MSDLPYDCMPSEEHPEHEALFNFVRYLKSCYPNHDLAQFEDLVKSWAEEYSDRDSFQVIYDFESLFDKVLIPYGDTVTDYVLAHVDKYEIELSMLEKLKERPTRYDEKQKRLLKVCCLLADLNNDDGRFFLSMKDAADYIGLADAKSAGSRLEGLCRDGFLELVMKGTRGTRGKATEYRLAMVYWGI